MEFNLSFQNSQIDRRINEIVSQDAAPLNRNGAEIAGYRGASVSRPLPPPKPPKRWSNRNKSGYRKALKDSSDGWHTSENSHLPFI
jgi:hypothetical protein